MWEHWFQKSSVTAVRDQLKSFTAEIDEKEQSLKLAVGSKYPELLALAQRLESLSELTDQVESRLLLASQAPQWSEIPNLSQTSPELMDSVVKKLEKMLTTLISRSLVQNQLKSCAQAIYLGRMLGFGENNREFFALTRSLDHKLQHWLTNETQLPQSVYLAGLIYWQCTPVEFLKKLLALRSKSYQHFLKENVEPALQSIDYTIFIYEQVVTDLSRSKLPQRRLIDISEFKQPGLRESLEWVIQNGDPASPLGRLESCRAFPDQCYTTTPIDELITSFLHAFTNDFRECSAIATASASQLVSMLSLVIQQTQSALAGEKYQTALLTLLLPIFKQQLVAQIASEISSLQSLAPTTVADLRSELQKLAKLAKQMRFLSSELADLLEQTLEAGRSLIEKQIDQNYRQQFDKLVSFSPNDSLSELSSRVQQLQRLNTSLQQLNGQLRPVPAELYVLVGEKLAEHPLELRVCWGDSLAVQLWARQRVMDEFEISSWESGLEIVRDVVMQRLEAGQKQRNNDQNKTEGPADPVREAIEATSDLNINTVKDSKGITESASQALEEIQSSHQNKKKMKGQTKNQTENLGAGKLNNEKSTAKNPSAEKLNAEKSDAETPNAENSSTEKSDAGKLSTKSPSTDKSDTGESSTESPSAEKSDAGKSSTDDPSTESPRAEDPDAGKPNAKSFSIENSSNEKSNIQESSSNTSSTKEISADQTGAETELKTNIKSDTETDAKPNTEQGAKPNAEQPSTDSSNPLQESARTAEKFKLTTHSALLLSPLLAS